MAKKQHLGFKETQVKIARKQGVSVKAAGAILASSARKASPKAVKKNPALLNVKRGVKKYGDGGKSQSGDIRKLTAAELMAKQKKNPYLKKAIVKKYKTSAPEGYEFGKTSMDSVAAANMGMPLKHFNVVKKKGVIQGTRKGTSTGDPMDIMRNGGKVTKFGDGGKNNLGGPGKGTTDSTAYYIKKRDYMDSVSKTPRGIELDKMNSVYDKNNTYKHEAKIANKDIKRQSKKGKPGYDENGFSEKELKKVIVGSGKGTTDSTAIYKRELGHHQGVLNIMKANNRSRSSIKEQKNKIKKDNSDLIRQTKKGLPGYDANGFPLKKSVSKLREGGRVTKYGDGGLQKAKGQYIKAKGQSIKAKGQYIKAKGLEIKAKGQNMKPEVPKSIYKQSYSVSSPSKDFPLDKTYEKKQVLNKGPKTIVNRKSFFKLAEGYKSPMYKSTTVYDKKTGATKKSVSKIK